MMTGELLTLEQAMAAADNVNAIADEIGVRIEKWPGRCHEVSLAILRTGRFGRGRMCRGTAPGITSQHSWFVLGDDCYAEDAIVVDPTIVPATLGEPYIVVRKGLEGHKPHGSGSIWTWGQPTTGGGPDVELNPAVKAELGPAARAFLRMIEPLDASGWAVLAHAPVGGWPAGEIFTAMDASGMGGLIPIDVRGMITDLNPSGLYW